MKPTAPAFTALLCLAAAATAAADAEPATTTVCGVAKVEERRCHRAPCPSFYFFFRRSNSYPNSRSASKPCTFFISPSTGSACHER